MILQVASHTREINKHIYSGLFEKPLGTDAAALKDVWAMQRAGSKDDLLFDLYP